jgi:hypothetical protein
MSAVAVKPGRTSGTGSSSTTTTLKFVACVAVAPAARLDRAVADLADVSLERVGDRVDRDLRALIELHVRDVGFVDFDFRLDHRHVGELSSTVPALFIVPMTAVSPAGCCGA